MTLGIIVQARMGSSRLPGKILREIAGKPLLAHVTGRLEAIQRRATVVIATSILPENDVVEEWCKINAVRCFRGSELDVLDRYHKCAECYEFSEIIRLTADNPFTDVAELDRLIDFHQAGGYDYCHTFAQLPVGVGAEIFTFRALEQSNREGSLPHQREHVNEYFTDHPNMFRIGRPEVPAHKFAPELRLTVDTVDDLKMACWLASKAQGLWLETDEAIALCSSSV